MHQRRGQALTRLIISLLAAILAGGCSVTPNLAQPSGWENVDRAIKPSIFQINVAIILRLADGSYVQISDTSPKHKRYVFNDTTDNRGYRVVGFGTCFPVKTARANQTYFLTNRHVVDSAIPTIAACEQFYSAMRLYAEQTATSARNVEAKYKQLRSIVRLPALKKAESWSASEKASYNHTVDAIWDCYETYLSEKKDKNRELFGKYLTRVGLSYEIGYFLHPPGPVETTPFKGHVYKKAGGGKEQPDLAILFVKSKNIAPLELETLSPSEGQEVQVAGYPIKAEFLDPDSMKHYAPSFKTGKVSRVAPSMIQIDAPIDTGNSGGPVVNRDGNVVGIVSVRAVTRLSNNQYVKHPRFGGAIPVSQVTDFAPELFEVD